MQRDLILEQKLRKSQSLGQEAIYVDFMQYAKQVQDQMDIYLYMEENKIGLSEAKYWLARLDVLKKRSEFRQLAKELRRIKKMALNDFWQIKRYETQLVSNMRTVFSMQCKGKRKAADFNISLHNIQQEKRKIGNIQVYVDQQYRHHYELDDLASYIEDHMKEYCDIERECYAREQSRKPPSFIAKREMRLLELASQVCQKVSRKSQQERKSMGPMRVSSKVNQGSVKFEAESYNTPKNYENAVGQTTEKVVDAKEKRLKDSSRDSIEILKSMRKEKKETEEYKSPKFFETSHLGLTEDDDFLPPQRCRYANTDLDHDEFLSFSFGKSKKSPEQCKRILNQRQLQNKDNAFMFHSFSQDSRFIEKQNLNLVKKQDFQLELIIKEIQRQTYEKMDSKTFSEIDSNQENQYGNAIVNPEPSRRQRKPFEILLQAQGKLYDPKKSNMKLQDLMDYDDQTQNRNPEDRPYFTQQPFQSATKRLSQGNQYHSQSKRPLSHVSQQNSCFYSQSKNKHRISK